MKYIFSKERYKRIEGESKYEENRDWVDECDQKEVFFLDEIHGFVKNTGGFIDGEMYQYRAVKDWCKLVQK